MMNTETSSYDNTHMDQRHLDGADNGSDEAMQGLTVQNDSTLKRMFWIGVYSTLLGVITLTIFRFWGRTDFRKQLWSDTRVGGEPLEYTGKAMELFIGFVIAMFVFMLPYLGFIYYGQTIFGLVLFSIILLLVYLFIFIIIGVAIFLARRYLLSRTRLRGIRFAQTGSAWGYGFAVFGYGIITWLTLGWFGPVARINLSKKMWDNAYFGDQKFSFSPTPEAKKEPVYLSFTMMWVAGVLIYVLFGLFYYQTLFSEGELDPVYLESATFILKLYGFIIFGGLFFSLFAAWHQAVMIRYIIKSMSVAGVSLSNVIKTRDIIELTITNTLMIIFTLGIGIMPAQMRIWKRIANAMSITGNINFEDIKQSTEKGPSQGEGLADGLDIAGGF